jgi:hypothetical protein
MISKRRRVLNDYRGAENRIRPNPVGDWPIDQPLSWTQGANHGNAIIGLSLRDSSVIRADGLMNRQVHPVTIQEEAHQDGSFTGVQAPAHDRAALPIPRGHRPRPATIKATVLAIRAVVTTRFSRVRLRASGQRRASTAPANTWTPADPSSGRTMTQTIQADRSEEKYRRRLRRYRRARESYRKLSQ